MAVLVSPGVDVQIIDESFYGGAGPGTVPLIIMATAANKPTPAGDEVAPFTVPAVAGRLFLATSQRELLQNFGNPTFQTAQGTPLFGSELNEWGLHAAYSYLGVSNRAYVIRADIDLDSLASSDSAPRGTPIDGTYWLDIIETQWGVFQSNGDASPGLAWVPQTVRVVFTGEVDGDFVPLDTVGSNGEYAVVPLTAENLIYEKIDGEWLRVGTTAWLEARPTLVRGSTSPSALTIGHTFTINGVTVTVESGATNLSGIINTINTALTDDDADTEISAESASGALQIRHAGGLALIIANGTGTALTTLGITPGTYAGNTVTRTSDAQYPADSVAGDVWVKGTTPNRGADWVLRVYSATTGRFTSITVPFYPFDSTLLDSNTAKDAAARTAFGSSAAVGTIYVGYDSATGVQALRRWNGSIFEQLIYEADRVAPTTDPEDGTLWFSADFRADIMYGTGTQWIAYRRFYTSTSPDGPIFSGSAPTTQSDGTDLVDNDVWIDTSDTENYPVIRRYTAATRRWTLVDNTDQTTPFGIVFADARGDSGTTFDGIQNSGDYTFGSELPGDMALSDFLDPDAPDPRLYPAGTLLFNTRYGTYNVKEWKPLYFENGGYDANTNYTLDEYTVGSTSYTFPALASAGRWVTASGNRTDGAPWMGRKAQRQMIVRAMAEVIASNEDLRSELVYYNLIAAPGYPELIDEMQTLNVDQKEVSLVVGDSPLRLSPSGTAIQAWATNAAGAPSNGEEGLTSTSSYTAVYYPWGLGTNVDGNEVVIPPSSMVLRSIAYNDNVAYQWFAPAGFPRGLISNASTVGYLTSEDEFRPVLLNNGQRDVLYLNRINPIAFIPNRGLVIYGQKTLSSTASALDRVNVARLACYLKYNLDNLVKPFLFEQNDEQTREAAKLTVERFLNGLVGQRALDDFAVLCNETNNTPERIDRNELWIDVLIQPLKAIEFIYIPVRIRNTGDDLNFAAPTVA